MQIPLLVLMLVLLLLSAYFSGSETALFSLGRLQAHRMRERRDRTSRRIRRLLGEPSRLLTTLLVGNNLVNIALSSIATVFAIGLLEDRERAVEVSTVAVTLLVLLVGETTPKTLAVNAPVAGARLVAGGLVLISWLLHPVTRFMHMLSVGVLRLMGIDETTPAPGALISRSELHVVLKDVDDDVAVITRHESRMMQNILDFSRRKAEQIMTPRVDIVDLDLAASAEQIAGQMRASRHSRYPVYREDPDSVIGFVQAKEYLLAPDKELREILRPVVFFPTAAPVDRIFSEMQSSRTAMVIIVNEYGETVGLITREDVVEEVVGDIYDEFDLEDAPIKKKGEGLFIVRGRSALADLNAELSLDLPHESSITLNGFLCDMHGGIPRPGTIVEWRGLRFHILEVARHQVRKVLIEITAPAPEGNQ